MSFARLGKIVYTFFFGSFLLASSYALVVEIPGQTGPDGTMLAGTTQVQADESTVYETIQVVNSYLRFSIGVVCMAVLIWGGIKLIMAQGDDKKMSEANKLLMGALIGIIIALVSYALVRLITNLLA